MATEPLLHLVASSSLDPDAAVAAAPDATGVVACVTPGTAAGMARLLHAGTEDLVLLVVDPRLVGAEVRWRDAYGLGRTLPEVVGPLPRTAVVDVVPFPPGPGGRWSRPDVPVLP